MSGIAITFPSSPSEGQSYLAQNGFTYIYDSQKNRWKRGGEFVRAPKVLSYAGVAVTTTGSGITTGPTGALIYEIPGLVNPNSTVGVDSYKAYRASESYPNYTEVQVSISSAFSSVAYAATFTGTTHTIPAATLSGDTTYYLRARQFVGSDAASAGVGAISGYSQNVVSFATTSTFIDTPVIVSISGSTDFPVYQIGYASTTLPATVTYTGSGVNELERVDWRVTGPRIPSSTGDTALAEVGVGTHSSATLANALVLALPFSGATGVGITDDVNNAIRTASGASAGTTKTITANGGVGTTTVAGISTLSHFYDDAAYFDGSNDFLAITPRTDFEPTGNTPFTFECWIYPTAYNNTIFGTYFNTGSTGAGGERGFLFYYTSTGAITVYMRQSFSEGNIYPTTTTKIPLNTWTHIAIQIGAQTDIYFNGILQPVTVGYFGTSSSADGTRNPITSYHESAVTYLGANIGTGTTTSFFKGYLQDVKIYNGQRKYTESFTPPLPTYGTISYTTGTTNTGINTTAYYQSTGDVGIAETSSTAADALVLAMPMNKTFGFQDINVAIRGLTSGASAGTAKTVGLGTTSTANAPTHPTISVTESKWYDGAAYFNGQTGLNYASVASPLTDFSFGTGDFTIEFWVYMLSWNTQYNTRTIIEGRPDGTNGDYFVVALSSSGDVFCNLDTVNVLPGAYASGKDFLNSWFHIAICRQSGSQTVFVNGKSLGSKSSTTNSSAGQVAIGKNAFDSTLGMHGYLQDLKIYKGFAKYTADFTPPQPICGFSTDISTQTGFTTTTATGELLSSVVGLGSTSTLAFDADTHYSGITSITSSSGITTLTDPYAQNLVLALPLADITGVGNSFTNDRNTQIRSVSLVGGGTEKTITNNGVTTSTSVTKWYDSSAYFGGNPNYASISSFSIGENVEDFTFETWVYTNDTVWMLYAGDTSGALGIGYNIDNSNQGLGVWSISIAPNTTSGVQISYNKWTHIAVCRKSGVISFYVDGEHRYSASNVVNYPTNSTAYIGRDRGTNSSFYYTGYLQDLKIYKGLAKYTTNFTPPPPMFGDYTRSTPNKVIFTPASDYVLEAKNTSGITTSSYSATRQWGTKPKGGIYDTYASSLVLAIPGNNNTSVFDVTGQIKLETPTSSYSSGQTVTSPSGTTYTNKSVTANGNAATSATQYKYYGRSIYFDGSGDYLTTGLTLDSTFAAKDYTIEWWMRSGDDQTEKGIFGVTGSQYGISARQYGPDAPITVYFGTGTSANLVRYTPRHQDTWIHVAMVKSGSTGNLYVNGVFIGSCSASTSFSSSSLYIGSYYNVSTYHYLGYIQDFRVYEGAAKYTSNFTPPNQIYI